MYREIVTKAVVGKGKITNVNTVNVVVSNTVSKVLGCWVINHYFVHSFENGKVYARGKYDLHLWYGFNNDGDTAIHKQTIDYIEEFPLRMKDGEVANENNEFIIKSVKYPTCNGLTLNDDGGIEVKVEKELSLDVVGNAKLRVQVSDIENVYDDLDDINVNYLNKE